MKRYKNEESCVFETNKTRAIPKEYILGFG